jgi:hypothetical protein
VPPDSALFCVGVPLWPHPSTGWDWWPVVGVIVAFAIMRWCCDLRSAAPVLLVAVVLGAPFSWSIHAWGVLATSLAIAAISVAARWIVVRWPPPISRPGV